MTPTCHVWLPTYNRPRRLLDLLYDLEREAKEHPGLLVTVHDDGSTEDYSACKALIKRHRRWEFIEHAHRGKEGFWALIADAHQGLKASPATYFVQMADDFRLCQHFLSRAINLWRNIDDPAKVALSLVNERARTNSTCWGGMGPVRYSDDVRRVEWLDCSQMSERRYYELFDWSMIRNPRFHYGPSRGSGVGPHCSYRLREEGLHAYQVHRSMIVCCLADSQMNLTLGAERLVDMQPVDFVDGPDAVRRLQYLEPVTASMASIPSREHMLRATVESILPQVDRLNVMLNGYDHVPGFLKHPRIKVARSQKVGDWRCDAKLWWCEETRGYSLHIDDDVVYGPDYVPLMVAWIEQLGRRAVVGYHGARIKFPLNERGYYHSRQTFRSTGKVENPEPVHVLGSGAFGYHTSTWKLTRDTTCCRPVESDCEHNMTDILIGLLAQKQHIPLVVIPHVEGFVRQPIADMGIWERSHALGGKGDGSVWDSAAAQTRAVESAMPWTLYTVPEVPASIPVVAPPVPVRRSGFRFALRGHQCPA